MKTIVGGPRWAKPGTRKRMTCRLCGRVCQRVPNVSGPTNLGMAMRGVKMLHDLFECPNDGEKWHNMIAELRHEQAETKSPRVRALIELDIAELRAANACAPGMAQRAREMLARLDGAETTIA